MEKNIKVMVEDEKKVRELSEEEKVQREEDRKLAKELVSYYAEPLACQLIMACRYDVLTPEEFWDIALGIIEVAVEETNGMSEKEFGKWIYNKGNRSVPSLVKQLIDNASESVAVFNSTGERNEKSYGIS